MSFTLNRDTTGVPVSGYDYINDLVKTRILDQYGSPLFTSSNPGQVSLMSSNAMVANVASITTASTAQALPAASCKEVTVTALKGNTGTVYVGGSNVSNSYYGIALDPKDSFTFSVSNADLVYIYGAAGDGVSYVAL